MYPEIMGSDAKQDLDALVAKLKAKQKQLIRELPDIDPEGAVSVQRSLFDE